MEETKTEIFEFIEIFYNPVRRHGTLGMISPNLYELNYFKEKKKAVQNIGCVSRYDYLEARTSFDIIRHHLTSIALRGFASASLSYEDYTQNENTVSIKDSQTHSLK